MKDKGFLYVGQITLIAKSKKEADKKLVETMRRIEPDLIFDFDKIVAAPQDMEGREL